MSGSVSQWALAPVNGGVKPLDVVAAGITGSVAPNGRLIALNGYHPDHGYVTLTAAPPFDEDRRYDPAAVRAYRAGLAGLDGFGPRLKAPVVDHEAYLLEGVIPHVRLAYAGGATVEGTTLAVPGGLVQIWDIYGAAPVWSGDLVLQRCAYTQLTEGGPVAMPPVRSDARLKTAC